MFIRRQFTPTAHWIAASADSITLDQMRGAVLSLPVPKDTNSRRVYMLQTSGGGTVTGRLVFRLSGQTVSEITFKTSSGVQTYTRWTFGHPGFGLISSGTGPNTLFVQLPGSAAVTAIMPVELSIACDRVELSNDNVSGPATGWTSILAVLSYITAN